MSVSIHVIQCFMRRVWNGILARLRQVIDNRFQVRHPNAFERMLIRAAGPIIRQMKPADRWSLPVHAPYWVRVAATPEWNAAAHPCRIFIFCAYRGQFTLDLSLAALLAFRGHQITFGYLPKLRSPVKQPLADHPSAASYLKDAFAPLPQLTRGRIAIVDLSDYVDPAAPVDEAFLGRQIIGDTVMMTGRESLDRKSENDRALLDYNRARGRLAQQAAWGYLASRAASFDLSIVPNGTTFEAASVCNVMRRLNVPFNTIEKFAFRNVRILNHGDDFRSFRDLDLIWETRAELGYTGAFRKFAADRAYELMNERRLASVKNWAWTLQNAPRQAAQDSLKEAGLESGRNFVLVCTNVPYDAGYDKLTRIFPSMRDWLIDTVRCLIRETDATVVVRCHPAEAAYWGGKEKSDQNLLDVGLTPSERLIIIPAEHTINTYGLMEHCKLGVVFSSTTGLEMAMMGRRVLTGAEVYYGRRGFTADCDDRDDYLTKLRELASSPAATIPHERMIDARLFHFLLHFVMQWPYPWHKDTSLGDLPPHVLVRSAAFDTFLPTLEAIALPPDEFHQRMGEFLSTQCCRHLPRSTAPAREAVETVKQPA